MRFRLDLSDELCAFLRAERKRESKALAVAESHPPLDQYND